MLETPPRSGTSSPTPEPVPSVDTPVHHYSRRQGGLSPEVIPLELSQQSTLPGEMATAGASQLTFEQPQIPETFHEQSGDEMAREDVAELERWEQEQMKKVVSTAPLSYAGCSRPNTKGTVCGANMLHRAAHCCVGPGPAKPQLTGCARANNRSTPVILALEECMMSLLCQRSEKLVQRRHQDIKDQAEECNIAVKAMRGQPVEANNQGSQQRSWRAAEREGRRVRRHKAREAQHQSLAQPRNLVHHGGMSTDDEQLDADRLSFDKERELILDDARHVFEDVTEQFSSVTALKQKFERWKGDFGKSYEQAYIPLCLVKLLVSFVRLQMVAWNPIEKPESPESCGWYNALLFCGEDTPEDPDLCLLPRIVERVLLPKMAGLTSENVWHRMSSTQTLNLVWTAKKLVEDYPTVNAQSRHLQNFMAKMAARIGRALDEDVYIPLYPKEVLENRPGTPAAFFHRQFWSCLKLVSTLPTPWLRESQLPQLELLTRFLRLYLQHLEGVSGSSNLGPDMHARNALEEVGKLLASLTDKTK
ncbi:PAX3- and PAX7-binding protein 1-like [Rhipicephalus microplus]|uniref:PAX3- and PAX7-binding protein 1-like n=1 Tax=Rhipicephalus microplus TaxID=6941 RepID=UPI003F6CE341